MTDSNEVFRDNSKLVSNGEESDLDVFFDPTVFSDPQENTPESDEIYNTDAQKRAMTIFLLIETSYAMSGDKIAQVNQAIAETIPLLKDVQDSQYGVVIQVEIMTFDSDARWITPIPEPVDQFIFSKIEKLSGGRYIGFAFDMLKEKLSRKAFMNSVGGHFQPLILLLLNGEPLDSEAWPSKLDRLYHNIWFQASTRIAIAIDVGDNPKGPEAVKVMEAFTKNKELILYPSNLDQLKSFVRLVTVHASRWNTSRNSQDSGDANNLTDPIDTINTTPDWFFL